MENRLRDLRLARQISQLKMSIDIGVSQEAISAFEREKTLPGVTTVIKIAKYFGVSVDYLLCLSENPKEREAISIDESYVLSLYGRLLDVEKEKAKSYMQGLADNRQ